MIEDEKKDAALVGERIHWNDDDEAGRVSRQGERRSRRRSRSKDSLSIHRAGSRNRADPSLVLPVTYRTVSFNIEESKGKEQAELAKAKDVTTKALTDLEWHTIAPFDVEKRLTTSSTAGLSSEQAERRQREYGRNAPSPAKTHWFRTVFLYFFGGFGSILLTGCILVFVSWKPLGDPPAVANLALAIVLLAVFFIQALFNMFQDWSTSRTMSSIKNMLPEEGHVIRDGHLVDLNAADIVPGDVIKVKAGNKLPADIRLIEASSDVKFDRSVLTGESKPVAGTVDHTDTNYLETHNIGLQGTHCILGSCTGIVVATGDRTVFGRIASLTNEPKVQMTTLEKEVLNFVVIIASIMISMIAVVCIIWGAFLKKKHPDFINVPTLIVNCVSVAIAFIPEGLPISITAGLTITANLMKKNKILCKSLKTVETLGSVSVICSDKTGTLTTAKMAVSDCAVGGLNMTIENARGKFGQSKSSTHPIIQLRALAALCNASEFDAATKDAPLADRRIFGDATDQAVLRFAEFVDPSSVDYLRACWNKIYDLAFNSKNKFMIRCFSCTRTEAVPATLSKENAFNTDDVLLTIKGAPDVLVGRCSHYVSEHGETIPLNAAMRATVEQLKNKYSSQGKRCLLLARKIVKGSELPKNREMSEFEHAVTRESNTGLTLVGMVAIVDPLRHDIPHVVSTLRGAGIRIAMVTGDFALTALAIAREAGIVTSQTVDDSTTLQRYSPDDTKDSPVSHLGAIVLSGPELMSLNEHQWETLTHYEEIVFARTTPEQKLRIVREFQKGNVVAMTGDGVNDAPSLRAADVGISMGSGSDIAMEAADMVLLDTFSSIIIAVQYGRVVFDNLKKVISYLLPAGSFSEFWPVMAFVAFGLPQALSSFLMIIICCFTDCAAATMLSYEKPEADVLIRPPRNIKKDRLVNWQLILQAYGVNGVLQTFASFAMAFWYLQRQGIPFSELWFSFGKLPAGIDPDYYLAKTNEASSIYFVNLVVMQWFNLMAARTRRLSIFQHPPLFNPNTQNWYLFPAIIFSLAMAIFWLYIPPLQPVLGTTPVPVEHWFLPFAFGIFQLLLDEAPMESFPFERLPTELKIKIITFAIPSILARYVMRDSQLLLVSDPVRQDETELRRIRASCPEIKTICDQIRYLVVCSWGGRVSRLDPVRDTFGMCEPFPSKITQIPCEKGPESSEQADLPIRRMLYWTGMLVQPHLQQSYAELPFNSLPIWTRTPILKAFTMVLDTCDRIWHIESFQQHGPKTRNDTLEEEEFLSTWGASRPDIPPRIGFHGYSGGNISQGGKWPGFRYWTETKKVEFRTLTWPEVQPCAEDCPTKSSDRKHPDFIARLWINRPGESVDAEQSQYGWIEVKDPEEDDALWVEQVATTWKMVRHMMIRMDRLMDFEWHLDN
ncbi:K, P-type ATPase (mediates high-affinity potassium or sodium uptake) [Fusarium bulbicola]|nr:K, P-type ATPase (mediates high-affinity potassium or sodium uptake) [Fusarium bulbicola]